MTLRLRTSACGSKRFSGSRTRVRRDTIPTMAVDVDVKKLLEAGAHFGHKTSRWHPRMSEYIHSKRGGSHIIDLTKTAAKLESALQIIESNVADGKQVLIVGTKRQARPIAKQLAEATKQPYVTERWLGGMLTNRTTISGRIKYLKDLEAKMENGTLASRYSKLEVQRFQEEIDQLNHVYGGIKNMAARVGIVFVFDMTYDVNAVAEATKLGIPVIALADTNANPAKVTYPIPCNDDAIKALQLVADYVQQAIEAGASKHVKQADKTDA
ncbi:30S ribosomal protein S2 [Candidatus Saccharibacteria bacterium]|nr:MAG: 30S ribosomal protein S2 [Candidatus Saccharibacteria bacterium]